MAFHNKNAVNTLTIGCMRPAEGSAALTCELVFDSDYNAGLRQYKGCATLQCLMRKNDQERKGHQMRFGTDPQLDLLFQLGLFMDIAGTRPRTNCNGRPNKRCTVCPPLFPKLTRGPGGTWVVAANPSPTPALVSSMVTVTTALRTIGVHSSAFSGVSCRMGGLTVAAEAGVPESIMWMQSGHAQSMAARRYVHLTDPDRLYDTWRAFRL